MRFRSARTLAAVLPALALGAAALPAAPLALQQPADPQSQFLAAIHSGDCRQPSADPLAALATLGPEPGSDGEPAGADDRGGQATISPLITGSGSTTVPLDTLLDETAPTVLVVHQGTQPTDGPLACGEIGGVVVDDQLTLALRPLADSGYAGVAALGADDDGGTAGSVVLFADVDALAPNAAAGNQRRAGDRTPRADQGTTGTTDRASGGRQVDRAAGAGGEDDVSGGLDVAPVDEDAAESEERARRTPRVRRTPTTDGTATATAPADATAAPTGEAAAPTPDPATETPPCCHRRPDRIGRDRHPHHRGTVRHARHVAGPRRRAAARRADSGPTAIPVPLRSRASDPQPAVLAPDLTPRAAPPAAGSSPRSAP
jgi:hypothetical protein